VQNNSEQDTPLVWTIPEEFPEALIGNYDRKRSPDRFEYRKGQPVEASLGTPVFVFSGCLEDLLEWDVLPNDAQLPLVNGKVAELLTREAGADVQLLAAIVEHQGGAANDHWKLLNITRAVQAIDHAASKYSLIDGTRQILRFDKLRYRSGALGDVKIARDAEYKSHILVSHSLADALIASKARGLALSGPEDMEAGA